MVLGMGIPLIKLLPQVGWRSMAVGRLDQSLKIREASFKAFLVLAGSSPMGPQMGHGHYPGRLKWVGRRLWYHKFGRALFQARLGKLTGVHRRWSSSDSGPLLTRLPAQ